MNDSATTSLSRALVTGTAGFIGFHVAQRLLETGWTVVGIDGMTPYYDLSLKRARHDVLQQYKTFSAHEIMLENEKSLSAAFAEGEPDIVIHLAAQAGVRYSLENPRAYVDSNLIGTFNLMEEVRRHSPAHFLMASTSSVYGANTIMPFGETDRTDHPLTLYAATKKAGEAMTHSYSHLWKIPTTVFRFFTVYGPWGRPDMALYKFASAILEGRPIEIYGEGNMQRDFTYIDDLVESIVRLVGVPPVEGAPVSTLDSLSPAAPWRVVNIGGGQPVGLLPFVETIERELGKPASRVMLPMQKGDVQATVAAPDLLVTLTGYRPATTVEEGVSRFIDWYRSWRGRNSEAKR